MAKTADEFVKQYNGKAIDYDKAYGVQCVDGFRVFCQWAFGTSWITGNGWADGFWYNRNSHKDKFTFVDRNHLRNGDWVVWARGSKSHPSSHIAMYYNGKEFGENQGGNRSFCLKDTNFSDCLGGLRWKGFPEPAPAKTNTNTNTDRNRTNIYTAYDFDKSIARTYHTTVNQNVRKGWSTKAPIIVTMPRGSSFTCYGYHTGDWYYGIANVMGKNYTGFAYKGYLR